MEVEGTGVTKTDSVGVGEGKKEGGRRPAIRRGGSRQGGRREKRRRH